MISSLVHAKALSFGITSCNFLRASDIILLGVEVLKNMVDFCYISKYNLGKEEKSPLFIRSLNIATICGPVFQLFFHEIIDKIKRK